MLQATTFKAIKLTLALFLEAQTLAACTYQQGQCINGELLLVLQREFLEVQIFRYDIISSAWRAYVIGKNSPLRSRACNQEATF